MAFGLNMMSLRRSEAINIIIWVMEFFYFALAGGVVLAAQSLDEDGEMSAFYLLAGIRYKFSNFIGLFICVAASVIILTIGSVFLFAFMGMLSLSNAKAFLLTLATLDSNPWFLPCLWLYFALMVSLFWFAVSYIVLNDRNFLSAFGKGFWLFWKNWLPMLVFILVLCLLMWLFFTICGMLAGTGEIRNIIVFLISSSMLTVGSGILMYVGFRNLGGHEEG